MCQISNSSQKDEPLEPLGPECGDVLSHRPFSQVVVPLPFPEFQISFAHLYSTNDLRITTVIVASKRKQIQSWTDDFQTAGRGRCPPVSGWCRPGWRKVADLILIKVINDLTASRLILSPSGMEGCSVDWVVTVEMGGVEGGGGTKQPHCVHRVSIRRRAPQTCSVVLSFLQIFIEII